MTNRFLGMANEAALAIYKINKNARVGFYAYSDYTLPPTIPSLEKLSPNLQIWIAPIRFGRYHPLGHPNSPSRQRLKTIIDGWGKHTSKLGYRTYNYNLAEILTPYSKLTTWAHDIPYLYKKGCVGFNFESIDDWELYAPHLYLSMRLAYNPEQDPWAIMADYWVKSYGVAAKPMQDYWLEVDRGFTNLKTESGSWHALHHVYTPQRIALLDQYLSQAEKLAASKAGYEQRVSLARRGWQRALYWRRWYDAMNRGDLAKVESIYHEWRNFVEPSIDRKDRNVNPYTMKYLKRFIYKITQRMVAAVYPEGKQANTLLLVLPDLWRYQRGDDIPEDTSPWRINYDDQQWKQVNTWSDTLNAQGFEEYFGDMWYRQTLRVPDVKGNLMLHFTKADRKVTVFINGKQVNEKPMEAFSGASLDVTGYLRPGKSNQVTIKVRHVPLPELFLGGIVGPIYLIERNPFR